jgi:regulatory protein
MGNRRGAARTDRATGSRKQSAPAPSIDGPARTEPPDPTAQARQICLDMLTTKARTRAELATALVRRGIDEDTVSGVLARFSEVGLIDDAAFAEAFVHSGHHYRGLGRRALAAQLRERGVDDQTTDSAVAAVDRHAEEEMARTLIRRRLASGAIGTSGTDDVATIRKLVGVLARRGYPEGLSYRVVRDELRAAGRDTGPLDDLDPN